MFDLQNQAVRGKLVWTDEKITIVIFLSNPFSWRVSELENKHPQRVIIFFYKQ